MRQKKHYTERMETLMDIQAAPINVLPIKPAAPGLIKQRKSTLVNMSDVVKSINAIQFGSDGMPIKKISTVGSLPDVECRVCGNVFKSSSSSSGDPYYPHFNAVEKTCNNCIKVLTIKKNPMKYFKQAGIPPKYLGVTLENFDVDSNNRKVFEFCKKYTLTENPLVGIYLFGPCGVGKTHLAVSVLKAMLLKGRTGCFTSTPDLLFKVRKTFSGNTPLTDEETLQQYLANQFLMLDDFGVEKPSEWVRQTLDHIIYHRDAAVMPLIITSNLDPRGIEEQLDNRISSRIRGMCCVLGMTGRDRRNINGNG
jgi:DNA replication protein DnaC